LRLRHYDFYENEYIVVVFVDVVTLWYRGFILFSSDIGYSSWSNIKTLYVKFISKGNHINLIFEPVDIVWIVDSNKHP
jgi:hypothetical protein